MNININGNVHEVPPPLRPVGRIEFHTLMDALKDEVQSLKDDVTSLKKDVKVLVGFYEKTDGLGSILAKLEKIEEAVVKKDPIIAVDNESMKEAVVTVDNESMDHLKPMRCPEPMHCAVSREFDHLAK